MANNNKNNKNEQAAAIRSLRTARRSIWYILRFMLMVILMVAICYTAFVGGRNLTNVYMITTEGMEYRADCILGEKTELDLREHFSKDFLDADKAITGEKYASFHVESYDYRLSIEKIKVYPWSREATVRAVERVVNIQAKPLTDVTNPLIPKWDDARIDIKLRRIDGRWYITGIDILERDPEMEPGATPDYSQLKTDIPHY